MTQSLRDWLSDVQPDQAGVFDGEVGTRAGEVRLHFDASSLSLRIDGRPIGGVSPEILLAPPRVTQPRAGAGAQPLAKFFVHVNNVCNLRCTYCYQQDLPYDRIRDDTLSLENLEHACCFIARSSGRSDVQLTYFGGEPFISFDRIISFQGRLEELMPGRSIFPNIVTNGTLVKDSHLEFLVAKSFHVMVSFDGTRQYQDHQRPGPHGTSSYDRAVDGIKRLVAAGVRKVSVRITYGQNSLDLLESIRKVAQFGVDDISFRPIMDITAVNQWPDEDTHFAALRGVVDLYLQRLIARDPIIINNVHELVRRIVQHEPKRDYCGWGKTCSVTPDGDIYPCTHFVGIPEFRLGTAEAGVDEAKRSSLLEATKIENLPCSDCNVKSLCGGGCRGSSHYVYGDIFREDDYCEARRELVHAVLLGIAELQAQGQWQEQEAYIQELMGQGVQKHSCDRFS